MTRRTRLLVNMSLGAVVGFGGLMINDNALVTNRDSYATQAEARVGRPLTPVSGAGVARRTTRRAAGVGVGVGAAAVGVGAAVRRNSVSAPDANGNQICEY
jgi:hypothetical protein